MIVARRDAMLAGLSAFARRVQWSSDAAKASIPIEMPGLRHVLSEVEIEGRRVRAVIDTGASRSLVSHRLAAELALPQMATHPTQGLTHQVQLPAVGPMTLSIGGHPLALAQVDVADLSALAFSQAFTIDAVIGQELFDSSAVRFDFAAGLMWIDTTKGPPPSGGWRLADLTRDRAGRMLVAATIEGIPAKAEVDLGSDVPVYVSLAACKRGRFLENRPSSTAVSAGVEGFSLDRIFTVSDLTLAGWTLNGLPARVPPGLVSGAPILLGLPVLRRFDLCFQANAGELWLRPSPTGFHQPFRKDRSGIAAGWTGENLRIVFVAPGSPAEKAGLTAGEAIAAVNGRKADSAFVARGERVGSGPAGETVRLELSGGRRITIRLSDYF